MIIIPILFFKNNIELFKNNKKKNKNKKITLKKNNNNKYELIYENSTINIILNANTIDNISMFFQSTPNKKIANNMIFKNINTKHYQYHNGKNSYNIFINFSNNNIKIIENEYDKIFKIKITDNNFKIYQNKLYIGEINNSTNNIKLSIDSDDKLIQFPIFISIIIYVEIKKNDKKDLDAFFKKIKTKK